MVWYGIPEGTPRMAAKMGGAMPTAAAAGGAAASAASEKRLELGLLRNLHRIEVKSIYDIYILFIIYVYIVVHTHVHIFLRSSTP
jgi:pilus assembly protein TadC